MTRPEAGATATPVEAAGTGVLAVHAVEVQYFAAVRAAAGVDRDAVQAATVAEALAAVRALHDERFGTVLDVCSLLVDGAPVGRRDPATVVLAAGSVVEALPPFAGG